MDQQRVVPQPAWTTGIQTCLLLLLLLRQALIKTRQSTNTPRALAAQIGPIYTKVKSLWQYQLQAQTRTYPPALVVPTAAWSRNVGSTQHIVCGRTGSGKHKGFGPQLRVADRLQQACPATSSSVCSRASRHMRTNLDSALRTPGKRQRRPS